LELKLDVRQRRADRREISRRDRLGARPIHDRDARLERRKSLRDRPQKVVV
jgi:hypothetical protein